MVDAMVTYDLAQQPSRPIVELPDGPAGGGRLFGGFTPVDFSDRIIWYSDISSYLAGTRLTNGADEFAPDNFFKLMSIVANKSESEFLGNLTAMSSAPCAAEGLRRQAWLE